MHRLQISIFGAVTLVFAVIGVNDNIFFEGSGARLAMGAGWLLLAIVDIIWLLYFTSDEESRMFQVFNFFGTGGLTPPSRRRRNTRMQSVHNMTSNNGYAANYAGGPVMSHDTPYDVKDSGVGSGAGSGRLGSGLTAQHSQHSIGRASPVDPNTSYGNAAGNASMTNVGDTAGVEPHSPLMGGGAAGVGAAGASTSGTDSAQPSEYIYKAKALYNCEIIPLCALVKLMPPRYAIA